MATLAVSPRICVHLLATGAETNRFESIRYGESKTNGVRFGRGHVIQSFTHKHIAQHTTLQITK